MYYTHKSSKSVSPATRGKQTKIDFVPSVSGFKSLFKPVISDNNNKILHAKLAIQKESTAACSDRLMNNKPYIKYDHNPFMQLHGKRHRFSNASAYITQTEAKTKRGKKFSDYTQVHRSIIDEIDLNSGKSKPVEDKRIIRSEKIKNLVTESQQTSTKILHRIERAKGQGVPQKKEKKQQATTSKPVPKEPIGMSQEQKMRMKAMTIEQIANGKENNFFFNEGRRAINVFKIPHQKQQNLNSFEQLQQLNFSFDSIVEKINKIKIPIYRQISKISRLMITCPLATSQLINILESNELSFKQNMLMFCDIMSFASGRIHPEFIMKINTEPTTKNGQLSDTSSQEANQKIITYHEGTDNRADNFCGENEEKEQIREFSNINLTDKQLSYLQRCKDLKLDVINLLKQQQMLSLHRINDSSLYTEKQELVDHTLMDYIGEVSLDFEAIAKQVRKNKQQKNKTEIYNLMFLLEALNLKNDVDGRIGKGSKGASVHSYSVGDY